jgi:hypothetical protein
MLAYVVAGDLRDEYMLMEESTCPRDSLLVLQNSGCFVSWRAKRLHFKGCLAAYTCIRSGITIHLVGMGSIRDMFESA